MKRFLFKITGFLLIGIILITISFFLPDNSAVQDKNYSILDKKAMLQQVRAPRLVLVGGSNLSFGINSGLLQDSLGIPVLNTGIHAGYGLKFMLDFVRPDIHAGDVILLSPEYSLFYGSLAYGEFALLEAMDVYREYYHQISAEQVKILLPNVAKFSVQKLRKFLGYPFAANADTGVYERRSFNKYGDVVAHWGLPKQEYSAATLSEEFNEDAFKLIRQFADEVAQQGAFLYVSFPCYDSTAYDMAAAKIQVVEKSLQAMRLKLVGSSSRYRFADSMFFNTSYHLNKLGVDLRTRMLIEDLRHVAPFSRGRS